MADHNDEAVPVIGERCNTLQYHKGPSAAELLELLSLSLPDTDDTTRPIRDQMNWVATESRSFMASRSSYSRRHIFVVSAFLCYTLMAGTTQVLAFQCQLSSHKTQVKSSSSGTTRLLLGGRVITTRENVSSSSSSPCSIFGRPQQHLFCLQSTTKDEEEAATKVPPLSDVELELETSTNSSKSMANTQQLAMTFKRRMKALSAKYLDDNGLELVMEPSTGAITAQPAATNAKKSPTAPVAKSKTTKDRDDKKREKNTNMNSKSSKPKHIKTQLKTVSARYLDDNGLELVTDVDTGAISAQPVGSQNQQYKTLVFPSKEKDTDDNGTVSSSSNNDNKDKETETFVPPIASASFGTKDNKHLSDKKIKAVLPSPDVEEDNNESKNNSGSKKQNKKAKSSHHKKDSNSNSSKEQSLKGSISNSLNLSKQKGIARAMENSKNQKGAASASAAKAEIITELPPIVDNSAKRAAARQQAAQQQGSGDVNYKPKVTSTRLRDKFNRKTAAGPVPVPLKEHTPKINDVMNPTKQAFNVVLTHCTADFDSLASAVGLAKLWSSQDGTELLDKTSIKSPATADGATTEGRGELVDENGAQMSSDIPTFVVLPRGAHPGVARFLGLHKHLFPIRSLKSLPDDLSSLNRLGLVDAQRRDRVGPAEPLLGMAKRVTILDHHIDGESDIPEATDYVVEPVGSVSTMVVERLQRANLDLSEAEATLLALGIHADTGSLCFDSTTPRDALALAHCMQQGASQPAIAEHAHSSLSEEQNGVLTQALLNTNSTLVHGVTVTTVLLR
jgi:hypothetical protein